jgi:hypothetical protein
VDAEIAAACGADGVALAVLHADDQRIAFDVQQTLLGAVRSAE